MKSLKLLKNIIFNSTELRKIILHKKIYLDSIELDFSKNISCYSQFKMAQIEDGYEDEKVYLQLSKGFDKKRKIDSSKFMKKESIQTNCNQTFIEMFLLHHNNWKIIKLKNEAILYQLENTVIQNLEFSDLKIPFSSFYVSIEKNLSNTITIGKDEKTYIDGAFVSNMEDRLRISIIKENTVSGNDKKEQGFFDLMFIEIEKDGSIKESIERYIRDGKIELGELGYSPVDNIISETLEYSLNQVLKTIMFYNLALDNKDELIIEKEDKIVKLNNKNTTKKMLKKYSDCNYTYIISSLSKKNKEISGHIKKHGKIEKKFIVSGHLRRQPFGSKSHPEYRMVLIEPYIKGHKYEDTNISKLNVKVV